MEGATKFGLELQFIWTSSREFDRQSPDLLNEFLSIKLFWTYIPYQNVIGLFRKRNIMMLFNWKDSTIRNDIHKWNEMESRWNLKNMKFMQTT